jgi:2'-5' RNA ligase/endonuclease/exonuclease/phosphatase family metal-dependent hydrolase
VRPADVILSQLRWDKRLESGAVIVVHEGRDGALLEARLPVFLSKGIPTHRVRALKIGGLTIWDRAARVDLLASDPDAVLHLTQPIAGALTIATWNVLGEGAREDRHAPPQEERAEAIVDEILRIPANVIALQEVEPSLANALSARLGARFSLVGAEAVEIVGGLLLLAPPGVVEVATPRVSGRRRALVARLASGETVVVVHLASDHRGDRSAVRRDQLALLLPLIDATPGVVIFTGDVNEDGPDVVAALTARGLVDGWPALHHDHGATFDPRVNPLARLISKTGEARRLDRVLVRGALPSAAQIIPSSLSDHSLLMVSLEAAKASHDSACAIVPPENVWPPINAIREELDPAYGKWPPHINLSYPFASQLANAELALAHALRDTQPFTLRLEGLGRFPRRDGRATIYLRPHAEALGELQRAIDSAVPLPRTRPVTHHLTVAVAREQPEAPVIEPFLVDEVVLFSRRAGKMIAQERVPFGHGLALPAALAETGLVPDRARKDAVARAMSTVDAAAQSLSSSGVRAIGSEALGVSLSSSDLDLVWQNVAAADALDRLARALGARVVDGAFSRVLRGSAEGVSFDVILDDEGAKSAVADLDALPRAREFVSALRTVRVWAAQRALVGAAACMPSSLAWAVLVARHLPMDEDEEARTAGLFRALAGWRPGPVIAPGPAATDGRTQPPDRDTARALTPSTAEALQRELVRAAGLCAAPRIPWRALFAPMVAGGGQPTVAALLLDDEEAARGRVAGRMRDLVTALEDRGLAARPDPRPFSVEGRAAFAVGLATSEGNPVELEVARPILERAGVPVIFISDVTYRQ